MEELKVLDLFYHTPKDKIYSFNKNIKSTLQVSDDYQKVASDTEWLDIMEDTIKYIDNILRNPNRFIVNEEDIVKIELARRVTVESIKHLSRNTNLIQDYDKKTGDVKPSKILNINKEESYNTYENRFIYSLIQNMKGFIARKKSQGITDSSTKDNKNFNYSATANFGEENVDISMQINSKVNKNQGSNAKKGESLADRVTKLEERITDLTSTEVYKTINRLHVALVTSPIKKTNVILKNVNFQYAVKLWNYMQENLEGKDINKKESKNYEDTGELKELTDETFLLNYLVINELNKEETEEGGAEKKEELNEKLVQNMVEQVLKINTELTLDDLKNIVGRQYEVIKYQQVATAKKIEEIFNKNIDKYLAKVEKLKI
ncbi:MAG: DUF2357 domain-containing protein [Bacilli bacterium]|nr:DUF2357 domain-containing protein [Bacilli bacterium]